LSISIKGQDAALRSALALHKMRTASIPFGELFTQFIETKAHRSIQDRKELKGPGTRFLKLHKTAGF
jgi:hypothetical protein